MARTHVSIHDVSPAFEAEIREAIAACAQVGATPALLVVPDFHGKWSLERYPAFAERLRGLQAAGHEIYLHGYYHLAGAASLAGDGGDDGKPGRLAREIAQRVVSAGEAEFSDVSRAEALARLDAGERVLGAVGLKIDGFVAPAWSMPAWLLPMLAARGVRYTEDRVRVYDPARGSSRVSLVLNFASRTPARLWSSVGFVRAAGPARRVLPTRIAIHPGDMRSATLRREVSRVLSRSRGRFVAAGRALLS
jgi:predicted deacetylase